MGATVNKKHVSSLIAYFASGYCPHHEFRYGLEIEHLPVCNRTDEAVSIYDRPGVEQLLLCLREHFDKSRETWEGDHLLGLARKGLEISLEPGSQIETSIGPTRNAQESEDIYREFRALVDPLLERLGFRLVTYGYQPKTHWDEISILPTGRYQNMVEYFGRIGQYGLPIMSCSSATQISIDFTSERDAIDKARVGTVIGPILGWFFRNTPYFEGEPNTIPLLRQKMWDLQDSQRTGVNPGLFCEGFGWEDYACNLLSTPLMIADMRGTPEFSGNKPVFIAWHENAAEIYPDRELNDYEIRHIISTHFNDVRMKNFIEFRHWDSLPIERVRKLMDIIVKTYCDPGTFEKMVRHFSGMTEADVVAAKAVIQAQGELARPYGQPLEYWRNFLGVGDAGADIPGDPSHPAVFQK